jgi:uncharacterized protein YndB with AHSA1/START domain
METVPKIEGRTLRVEAVLPAAPQVVHDYVAELRHMEHWWPEHWRYRRLGGNGGPGTRYLWIFVATGAILPGLTRIEANTPDLLVYRTAIAGLPIRMRYEFAPADAGTLLRIEMDSPGVRLPPFARMTGKQLTAALARLSAAVSA